MIVIDSMMNRSIRFVSVMNAGAARLRFRFPLVAITIGSRDGPCGFTIVIRCCNVVRASRQMSRVAMKAYSRPLYIYIYTYIYIYSYLGSETITRDTRSFHLPSDSGRKASIAYVTTLYPSPSWKDRWARDPRRFLRFIIYRAIYGAVKGWGRGGVTHETRLP